MKLNILEETFELDNTEQSIEEIFDYIKQALEETEYNFSYMIVDGIEVYDEFEIYLEDNIKVIEEVKVVMLSTKEIVRDNLITIYQYIDGAIPVIRNLSDNFHRGPDVEDWEQISDLFEGTGFIVHTFESIDSMENLNEIISDHEVWNEYAVEVKSFDDILKKLKVAMETKDTVVIGNLLISNIVPTFKNMIKKLEKLVTEGKA